VVQARTLEMMDLSALSDEFVRRGYRAPGFNVGLNSRKKPISVDMQGLDTRFPCMLVLPQGETEEILEKVKSTFQNLALFVYRSMAKKEVALWQESMV